MMPPTSATTAHSAEQTMVMRHELVLNVDRNNPATSSATSDKSTTAGNWACAAEDSRPRTNPRESVVSSYRVSRESPALTTASAASSTATWAFVARRTFGRGGWMMIPPLSTCVATTSNVMNTRATNNKSMTKPENARAHREHH